MQRIKEICQDEILKPMPVAAAASASEAAQAAAGDGKKGSKPPNYHAVTLAAVNMSVFYVW